MEGFIMRTIILFTAIFVASAFVACSDDDGTPFASEPLANGTTFEVDGIYYVVTDSVNKACGVTYGGEVFYSPSYSGVVDIPETVTYNGCTYSVTSIDACTFFLCDLSEVSIPNTITSIGQRAFESCRSLTEITIPISVIDIGRRAFCSCTSITEIVIPSSITSIKESTFNGCYSLTAVTIPTSVTSLGDSAFGDCRSLTEITIPSSVASLGTFEFSWCICLKEITIPDLVTSIGERSFEHCSSLTAVTIGRSVSSIGKEAFMDCEVLTAITSRNPVPPTCKANAFVNVPVSTCVLYVPKGSKEAYAEAEQWQDFMNIEETE